MGSNAPAHVVGVFKNANQFRYMNEKIKQHLVAYAAKNNWPTDDDTLIEIITERGDVYRRKVSDSRWWYTEFIVTEIDGMLIGYEYASANRDEHVRDLGWEFDPSTICKVQAVQKTVIVYEKVNPLADSPAINTMHTDPAAKQPDELKNEAVAEQATEQVAAQDQAVDAEEEGAEAGEAEA